MEIQPVDLTALAAVVLGSMVVLIPIASPEPVELRRVRNELTAG